MKMVQLEEIQSRIFTIRGFQVMLDKDLADFYGVKPIRLREQVKRNPNRFPKDFVFQLNSQDVDLMVSQNAIPSKQSLGGAMPYAFTEQGVAAVSGVLKSDKADEMSVAIARAFVAMRKFLLNHATFFQRLDQLELSQIKTDERLNQLFRALEAGQAKPDKGIFFEGQIFDAYVFLSSLIKEAKNQTILIDNYVDETVLTLLSKRNPNVKATILTKSISPQLTLDLKKHNSQYPEIKMELFANSHDRFLLLDEKDLYHFGASLKDLGKKWFAFSKMDFMANDILTKIKER